MKIKIIDNQGKEVFIADAELTKHIWEGWTVQDFIDELHQFNPENANLNTRQEVKEWCMNYQPYYKKYIKEVVDYFCKYLNVK